MESKRGESEQSQETKSRTYEEEMSYIERITDYSFRIKKGCVPNMKVRKPCTPVYLRSLTMLINARNFHSCTTKVDGRFYVNSALETLMFEELEQHACAKGVGGFLPAVKQIANVAALPGIVGVRILISIR